MIRIELVSCVFYCTSHLNKAEFNFCILRTKINNPFINLDIRFPETDLTEKKTFVSRSLHKKANLKIFFILTNNKNTNLN